MTGNIEGVPVVILREGTERTRGREAQRANILIAKALSNAIRTTLGPKGMDKMLIGEMGDITITNDGATIVDDMNVEHPAAKMLIEIAKTQDKETGDGTTTAVVLAGEMLKNAGELLDQNIHATVIIRGYRMAAEKAIEKLKSLSEPVTLKDTGILENIAAISMGGKSLASYKDELAKLVVDAVKRVAVEDKGRVRISIDDIKKETKKGGEVLDTQLIDGLVIDKERVHPNMPKRIENAKIALLDSAMEVKGTETSAEIKITSPDQLQDFLDEEENMLKEMAQKVADAGVTVLFCQKGVDDIAQHYLAKAGILTVRRVKKSDMEKLTKATGAKIVSRIEDISKDVLGYAKSVGEEKVSGEGMIFVRGCKNPRAVSLLIRGGTEHVTEEAERSLHDALCATISAVEEGSYVVGGGAIEEELALTLRKYAGTVGGREQLAIEAFAEALEVVPKTLAESAGMNPLDAIVELRSRHENGKTYDGINVFKGRLDDLSKLKVIEPTKVKKQAISSASEASEMLLRIDDIIAVSGTSGPEAPGPAEE